MSLQVWTIDPSKGHPLECSPSTREHKKLLHKDQIKKPTEFKVLLRKYIRS